VKEVHVWVDVVTTAEWRAKETTDSEGLQHDLWLGARDRRNIQRRVLAEKLRRSGISAADVGGISVASHGLVPLAAEPRNPLAVEMAGWTDRLTQEVNLPRDDHPFEYPAPGIAARQAHRDHGAGRVSIPRSAKDKRARASCHR